jgi:hypothetical protein
MDDINIALGRKDIEDLFCSTLDEMNNIRCLSDKRCIYVHGEPGVGKSKFVFNILRKLKYDIIRYNITDLKNKDYNELLYKNGVSRNSIRGMITKSQRRNIIVIDDNLSPDTIEKNILTSFIKLIRPKKNKRQIADERCITFPIVCICNSSIDKYTKPLMDACICIHVPSPTYNHLLEFSIRMGIPDDDITRNMIENCNSDIGTLSLLIELRKNSIDVDKIEDIFIDKCNNTYTKKMIGELLNNECGINYHDTLINEQDGNISGLLVHENIIDQLDKSPITSTIGVYYDTINMLCKTDINDRYIFGTQSWCISEPNNILKIMYPGYNIRKNIEKCRHISDIRFTKILNKHNIEHNNCTFITMMSNKLMMERTVLLDYFIQLRNTTELHKIYDDMMTKYDITILEINRIFKYIDNIYGVK